MEIRKAQRQQAKIRVGIFGPSGSGKTMSSLLLASGMAPWEKICLIDTENGSGDLYSNLGPYNVITLSAPFHPSTYIEAIKAAEAAGIEVCIIDSISHEWNGNGGCLEIHEDVCRRQKVSNSYTAWAQVTPLHQAFIDAILQSSMHIIASGRTKTEYVLSERNGKQVPQKVGMKIESRDGFEYELTIAFEIGITHEAIASKDRTNMFKDPLTINSAAGILIKAWCESGDNEASSSVKIDAPKPVTPIETAPLHPPQDDIMADLEKGNMQEQAAAIEKPSNQQIAIINSLIANAVFSEEERNKNKVWMASASKEKCDNLIKTLSIKITERQKNAA